MSKKRLTYDYDIVKKSGKPVDIERIKVDRHLLFEELTETESELFVAPAVGSRVVKIKNENELKEYLQNERFLLNEIQFFAVPRKDKEIQTPKTLTPPTSRTSNIEAEASNDVYQQVLKSLKNKGAKIKDN